MQKKGNGAAFVKQPEILVNAKCKVPPKSGRVKAKRKIVGFADSAHNSKSIGGGELRCTFGLSKSLFRSPSVETPVNQECSGWR